MAIEANNLLTLTFRENLTDLDEARRCWSSFVRSMRSEFGSRFQFVMVLERQKRGAWHIHAALHGFWPVTAVRRLWHAAVGGHGGNVDLQHKARKQPWRVAYYLVKYLTKELGQVGAERKRYSSSRGIELNQTVDELVGTADEIIVYAADKMGNTVAYFWDDEASIRGWLCSWSIDSS